MYLPGVQILAMSELETTSPNINTNRYLINFTKFINLLSSCLVASESEILHLESSFKVEC